MSKPVSLLETWHEYREKVGSFQCPDSPDVERALRWAFFMGAHTAYYAIGELMNEDKMWELQAQIIQFSGEFRAMIGELDGLLNSTRPGRN